MERAVARIDFDAIRANCARLKSELREGTELCAVVKADGYGHGADASADSALAGGATRLARPRARPNRSAAASSTSRC